MANTIKLKRGSGSDPGASDLSVGEVALRTDNGTLFTKNDAGNITEIGASSGVSDGDKGDITVSNSGATWSLDSGVVTTAIINNGAVNASKILDNVVSEAKLNVSNSPTNGYFLSAQSGNTGGLTWAAVDLSSKLSLTGGTLTGDLQIPHKLIHAGDTDTCMRFQTNIWSIEVGGNERIETTDSRTKFFHNIETTGTVDGVDIAARNTLFGGLTSSSGVLSNGVTATTQSANDNSTKVATTAYTDTAISNLVDSSPSALNTLNELAAALGDDANFSTTVTNNIATKLSLSGGTLTGDLTISSTQPKIYLTDTNNNSDYLIKNGNGDFNIQDVTNSTNRLTINSSGNATFSGSVTATGGFSGSGASLTNVNATTLDSIDSGSFLRSDASDTMSGILSLTSSSQYPLTINGSHDGKIVLRGSSNPYITFRESNTDKGYLQWHSAGYIKLQNQEDDSSIRIKDAIDFSTDNSTWNTVWHAGNDGSGSGLDADTLDGVQGASYLRSDTTDTFSGVLTIDSSTNRKLYLAGSTSPAIYLQEGTTNKGQIQWSDDGNFYIWNEEHNRGFQLSSNAKWYNGSGYQTLWHAGNDGAGSGLDADTVDGFATSQSGGANKVMVTDSSNYLKVDSWIRVGNAQGLYNSDGQHLIAGGNNSWKSWINRSDSGVDCGIGMQSNNAITRGYAYANENMVGLLNGSGSWVFRVTNGNSSNGLQTGGGYLVWHQQNDGSGSGLDADTLDGVQAGGFLRADTADTASADITFGGGAGAVNIAGGSDIRLTSGSWTGNITTPKITAHDNALYICGGSNGIRFRYNNGDRWHIDDNGHFVPATNNTYDIGKSSHRVRNIYTNDLHLSNEGNSNSVDGTWGDWTLQEGDENIFMINNRSGKKYKMGLVEVA